MISFRLNFRDNRLLGRHIRLFLEPKMSDLVPRLFIEAMPFENDSQQVFLDGILLKPGVPTVVPNLSKFTTIDGCYTFCFVDFRIQLPA